MDDEPANLLEALYIALDRLEALDPAVTGEQWFHLLENEADRVALIGPRIRPDIDGA